MNGRTGSAFVVPYVNGFCHGASHIRCQPDQQGPTAFLRPVLYSEKQGKPRHSQLFGGSAEGGLEHLLTLGLAIRRSVRGICRVRPVSRLDRNVAISARRSTRGKRSLTSMSLHHGAARHSSPNGSCSLIVWLDAAGTETQVPPKHPLHMLFNSVA